MDTKEPVDLTIPSVLPGRSAEQRTRQQLKEGAPHTAFQYVNVTFLGADTDYDVVHSLDPPTTEDIDYVVVRADRSTNIYHDYSGTRRAWGTGYIVVRSSAASAQVTLLLTIRR